MMRRLGLIAGIFVLLVAVGAFAMQGSAQDDAVPVLQTQVADLQTRVATLEGKVGMVPASPVASPIGDAESAYYFSDRGFGVTDAVILDSIPYRASFTCAGNPLGFVTMYNSGGIAEVIENGDAVMQNDAGTYWFDITCDMAWSLTITPLGS